VLLVGTFEQSTFPTIVYCNRSLGNDVSLKLLLTSFPPHMQIKDKLLLQLQLPPFASKESNDSESEK
jgi:hypothetical protein